VAKEDVLLVLANEVKYIKQEKIMCDAICDRSDLIDCSCDLVNDKSIDANMFLSCSETPNDDSSNNDLDDIYKDEYLTEGDELGYFENHTKGIGSKIMNKMGYDGKVLGKTFQGIQNPIQVYTRMNALVMKVK